MVYMEYTNETWVSCTFSQPGLDGSSELVKEDHPDLSFVQCIVLAMALNWVYLVILGATRGCILNEINAYALGEVTRDSIGGDSRCKTPDRVVGCWESNHFYPVGHVLEIVNLCGVLSREHACNGEGIFEWQEGTPIVPSVAPLTSCTSPFVQVNSVGCIYVRRCWILMRDNERVCQHLGGKMASPKTVADFKALRVYLITEAEDLDQFHAGAEYSTAEGGWVWKYHGRKTDSKEWKLATTETVGSLEMAVWTDFKLNFRSDDLPKNLLCMANF